MSTCQRRDGEYAQMAVAVLRQRLAERTAIELQVQSASMLPVIRPGDMISVGSVSVDTLRSGDIIVYERSGVFIVHRVLRVDARVVITKGDNARMVDIRVDKNAIIGKVVSVEKQSGRIRFDTSVWRLIGRLVALISCFESLLYACCRGKRPLLSDLSTESSA